MKKVLSVFLAVTMILAMIPTTFASAEEITGYKYVFSRDAYGSESDVSKATLAIKTLSDILTEKSAPWRPAGQRYILNATSNENGLYFYSGTGRATGSGNIGVELEVGAGGTYTPKLTYTAKNTAPIVDVFLVKEGTSVTSGTTEFTTADITGFDTKNGDVAIYHIADKCPEICKLGQINMYSDEETELTETFAPRELDANSKYYLLIRTVGLDEEHTTVTVGDTSCFEATLKSFELKLDKLDKTHNYIFNNTVLTGDILENTAFTDDYRMFYKPEGEDSYTGNYLDSYDNLNSSLTDLWSVSLFGGLFNSTSYKFTSSLGETRLQMIGRKRLNNGANTDANFVLKLNVKYDGIYAITAEVEEYINGTQADIYMFPADETITDINSEMLKNYNSIGRVSNVTGEGDGDVGTIQLTKGDWYFVFAFNSTNKSTATNSRQYFNLQSITLTETDTLPESGTTPDTTENIAPLSFSATTNIPSIAAVTINGNEGNLAVINPSRGAELSVSAPEVSGYKFIGWKAGAANDTGDGELQNTAKFVNGLEQEDTFTVYTSTFLTAVYEEIAPSEDADAVVEFWNLDGSYLGQKSVTELEELAAEDKTLKTSLIGHTFTGWFTAEDVALDISTIIEKVTHAVAGYTADATLAATGDDGVRVNGETDAEANAYGKEVICVDNKGTVTHWLRDGKVVSYDETYKYYVWDSTNITSSYAPVEKKPLVVLDGETVSDAYMIEYDGAGKNIVEVGILFGSGAAPTVESKSEIFKSQRGNNHGQFAAKPSDSSYTARGYMIYEENGTYKVIYSE